MPCTYYESPQELAEAAAKAKARGNRELNKVTDLLCQVCVELFTDDEDLMQIALDAARVKGLKKWWEAHQKRDAKRKSK